MPDRAKQLEYVAKLSRVAQTRSCSELTAESPAYHPNSWRHTAQHGELLHIAARPSWELSWDEVWRWCQVVAGARSRVFAEAAENSILEAGLTLGMVLAHLRSVEPTPQRKQEMCDARLPTSWRSPGTTKRSIRSELADLFYMFGNLRTDGLLEFDLQPL